MQFVACAICQQSTDLSKVISKWGMDIVRCGACGLCYVSPREFRVEDDSYFAGPYLATIEEDGAVRSGIQALYSEVIANLSTYLHPGRLLDVGCAMGHFMAYARELGWKVHGIECSRYAAEYGRKRWNLPIQTICDLEQVLLPDNHFDACVLIEVAEHLPDPRGTFAAIFRLLKPGGVVYITTPNFASYRSLLLREHWQAIIPTGHLYYFTADTLGNLLTAVGYDRLVNLTAAVDFEAELISAMASRELKEASADVHAIRSRTVIEDGSKLFNARGESLVMCATKPLDGRFGPVASLRYSEPLPMLNDRLVSCAGDTEEDRKVYLIRENRKHWVTTVEWLERHGRSLMEVVQVDGNLLQAILTGPPLA